MTVRFEVAHPKLGTYGVTLPPYRWGYVQSRERVYRSVTVNNWGRLHRIPVESVERVRYQVTFRGIDDNLDPLRTFNVIVQRYVLDVKFYPDYESDPVTYLTVDWPLTLTFNRILDNYQEVELLLEEQVG